MSDHLPVAGSAFLLAQLGSYVAGRYAERVAELGLTPAHTGLLRLVAQDPGLSQQALARLLGVAPSKVVALVDELQRRDLVERRRSTADRRLHALFLTAHGERTLDDVRTAAAAHDDAVLAPLTPAERERLRGLLGTLADAHGLTPGVHPGYRRL